MEQFPLVSAQRYMHSGLGSAFCLRVNGIQI